MNMRQSCTLFAGITLLGNGIAATTLTPDTPETDHASRYHTLMHGMCALEVRVWRSHWLSTDSSAPVAPGLPRQSGNGIVMGSGTTHATLTTLAQDTREHFRLRVVDRGNGHGRLLHGGQIWGNGSWCRVDICIGTVVEESARGARRHGIVSRRYGGRIVKVWRVGPGHAHAC